MVSILQMRKLRLREWNKVPKTSLPNPNLKPELVNCEAHSLSTLPLSPVQLVNGTFRT